MRSRLQPCRTRWPGSRYSFRELAAGRPGPGSPSPAGPRRRARRRSRAARPRPRARRSGRSTCCGLSPGTPSRASFTDWSVDRSISSGSRPIAAQCSRMTSYLWWIVSGPPKTLRRVRVLGDEAQGLLLAAAADHDRRVGARDRLGGVEEPARLVVAALERGLGAPLALPHARGRSGASPRASRSARRAAGTGSRGRATRPRSRRRRCPARRGRRRARRASSRPSPTGPGRR